MPSKAAQNFANGGGGGSSRSATSLSSGRKINPKTDEKLLQRISEHAYKEVRTIFENSPVFTNIDARISSFPKFHQSELVPGRVLGRGQFGVVMEVRGVNLDKSGSIVVVPEKAQDGTKAEEQEENRQFISENCIRNGKDARYAVKYLTDEVVNDPTSFYTACKDLALETHFLSKVEHTNIIKMRGIGNCGSMCDPSYFIVMDRLYDTLESRLVTWKKTSDKCNGVKGKLFDKKGKKKMDLLDERLTVAFDLAAAIGYLHKLNVLHRDIKPDNIGFDVRGDVKIFDFGLAKEMKQEDRLPNGLYKLTANTGSMRYMAPEIHKEEPYNDRADVYSLAILLWEILTMCKPFQGYNAKMLATQVFQLGGRPALGPEIPTRMQVLLRRSWAQNINERMSAENVEKALRKELESVRDGDGVDLELSHMRRRSTFVAPRARKGFSLRHLPTAGRAAA